MESGGRDVIQKHFENIETIKRVTFVADAFLVLVKAFAMGFLMLSTWQWLHPFQQTESFLLGFLVFILVSLWSLPKFPQKTNIRDGVLGLEIKHQNAQYSAFQADPSLTSIVEKQASHSSGDSAEETSHPFADRFIRWTLEVIKKAGKIGAINSIKKDVRTVEQSNPLLLRYKNPKVSLNDGGDPSQTKDFESRVTTKKNWIINQNKKTKFSDLAILIFNFLKPLPRKSLAAFMSRIPSGRTWKKRWRLQNGEKELPASSANVLKPESNPKIGSGSEQKTLIFKAKSREEIQLLATKEWQNILAKEWQLVTRLHKARLQFRLTALIVPIGLCFFSFKQASPSLSSTIDSIKGLVRNLSRGSRIEVVEGRSDAGGASAYNLGGEAPEIHLLEENLLQLYIDTGSQEDLPVVKLVKVSKNQNPDIQTFLATPVRNLENGQVEKGLFSLGFSSPHTADLFIPSLFGDKKLARLEVKASPVPKVVMSIAVDKVPDPWHDEDLLPLQIRVEGINPLQSVNLIISQGKREARETVANILKENEFNYNQQYRLNLGTYMESDFAEIEIVAEAIDRASPKPLIGFSEPLKLKVASAYGRYQMALQDLKAIKTDLDEAANSKSFNLDKSVVKKMQEAEEKTQTSPYFDGLDRADLSQMRSDLESALDNKSQGTILQVGAKLSEFLYEHESLDDRERDRDFFVAARALSRLLDLPSDKRPTSLNHMTGRMTSFLDHRTARWRMRVSRLPGDLVPKISSEILTKMPFHTAINSSKNLAELNPPKMGEAQQLLSNTVTKYRDWLEVLEAAETKARERREQNRQQSIANTENKLRELQKNQAKVLNGLDRAEARQNEISGQWQDIAAEQRANAEKTSALVPEMASVSPNGAKRLEMAAQAMQKALASGGSQNFPDAESHADLAGRLLNDSQRSLQEQKRSSEGGESRRRRRVTGDNYFGQNIMGGDVEVKHDYTVDRRYREDILNSIEDSRGSGEDIPLINNYLKKTVR